MIRTVFWYVMGWTYLVITLPVLLRVKYLDQCGEIEKRDQLVNDFSMQIARFFVKISGSTVIVRGEENLPPDGPVLFVSNHQGHMDSPIIHGYIKIPKGFVSIVEVKKFPILRTWMRYMKCIFLDRSDPKQSLECINEAVQFLKHGHSMVIFPEGKLSDGGEISEFRNGSLRLAIKSGVPIIPITIKGSYKIMNKSGSKIQPATIECIISKPINTTAIDRNGEKELLKLVRETIIEKL